MATQDSSGHHGGLADRLFWEHPRSLGMSWAAHGAGAAAIAVKLVAAGLACFVHAVIPGFFTQTAGRTVTAMYDHMMRRRAGAANPEHWPEYEI